MFRGTWPHTEGFAAVATGSVVVGIDFVGHRCALLMGEKEKDDPNDTDDAPRGEDSVEPGEETGEGHGLNPLQPGCLAISVMR